MMRKTRQKTLSKVAFFLEMEWETSRCLSSFSLFIYIQATSLKLSRRKISNEEMKSFWYFKWRVWQTDKHIELWILFVLILSQCSLDINHNLSWAHNHDFRYITKRSTTTKKYIQAQRIERRKSNEKCKQKHIFIFSWIFKFTFAFSSFALSLDTHCAKS